MIAVDPNNVQRWLEADHRNLEELIKLYAQIIDEMRNVSTAIGIIRAAIDVEMERVQKEKTSEFSY